jgi:hypothetical protein
LGALLAAQRVAKSMNIDITYICADNRHLPFQAIHSIKYIRIAFCSTSAAPMLSLRLLKLGERCVPMAARSFRFPIISVFGICAIWRHGDFRMEPDLTSGIGNQVNLRRHLDEA